MTETHWTAPVSGWYRIETGKEPRLLTDEEAEQADKSQLLRIENDGVEVRGFQKSGANIEFDGQVLPAVSWTTVEWQS